MRSTSLAAFVALFVTAPVAAGQSRAEGARDEGNPRAIVELIAGARGAAPGETLRVGVRFELDPGWHVYWHNPGDGAMATDVELSAERARFGELRWPAPERFEQAGLIVTYGYSEEVILLADATVSPDARAGDSIELVATADFLVCEVECIPDRLTVKRTVPVARESERDAEALARLDHYEARVPVSAERAGVETRVAVASATPEPSETFAATITMRSHDGGSLEPPAGGSAHAFFPARVAGIDSIRATAVRADPSDERAIVIELAGEASPDPPPSPPSLRGVVVLSRGDEAEPARVAIDVPFSDADELVSPAPEPVSASSGRVPGEEIPFLQVLLLALLGGLVLNLMPCVLPVLAIKAFGLAQIAGEGRRARATHAGAYAGGILASFAALALVVVAVRAGGTELGWGFQLQEPLFVAALAAVLVVFALHLVGVLEIRAPAGELAERVDRATGLPRSFGEGVLAVVVATPCTAPFLGTAVGFALASDAAVIFAVFLAVGAGLALPFVLLVLVPGAARLLPRPGPWMQVIKVLLAFALLGTVVWLAWLLGRVAGSDGVVKLLAFLLAVALATWIAGRWALRLDARASTRATAALVAVGITAAAAVLTLRFDENGTDRANAAVAGEGPWSPWSPGAVETALARGDVVFVDFTADWCITCKVNEALVLDSERVRGALAAEGVSSFLADWTRRDDVIRRELARHGRAGVPMYLVISPNAPAAPEVRPEVLTEEIVLEALRRAGAGTDDPS